MASFTIASLALTLVPLRLGVESNLYAVAAWLFGLGFLAPGIVFALRRSTESARHVLLASVIYLPLMLTAMVLSYLPGA